MKIAVSLISYEHLTGAELYVYELTKRYKQLGHDVLITAPNIGGEVASRSQALGIEVYSFEDCPSDWAPDVLHVNEYMPSVFALTLFPKTPAIATVHSQFMVEKPFVTSRISKYICIRPQVQEKLLKVTRIPKDNTIVIYNGVDFDRFKRSKENHTTGRHVLFVGTIDALRKKAILELINDSVENDYRVTIVGKKHDTYLDTLPNNVALYEPTWDVQKYFEGITETAGILLGRTTIEGWAAGIPGWIYEIDLEGNIVEKKLHQPPKDLNKFNIIKVADSILGLYEDAIKNVNVDFDSISLAEAQASVIANSLKNEAKINALKGQVDSNTDLINYLGSENYKVHLELQSINKNVSELHHNLHGVRRALAPLLKSRAKIGAIIHNVKSKKS